jgi:Zn-dependent protease with chaperone function
MIVRLSRGGGPWVAGVLGGKRVDPATTDAAQRRLLHVVEEMAIASGVPVPDVYVLPRETGLNAFAAGFTPGDAVIGVTAGAVKYLARDELQGVIAHEFSHILHGDMRLNMRLMGLVHGLFTITVLADALMVATHKKGDEALTPREVTFSLPRLMRDLGVLVVGFVFSFIGWHGAFFGRIIKGAVSRQREFLADAAAVQFTRNPEGLGGALQHARTWPERGTVHSPLAEECSHIFFVHGLAEDRFGFTATHPPLEQRVDRLRTMMGTALMPVRKPQESPSAGTRARPPFPVEHVVSAALTADGTRVQAGREVSAAAAMASVGVPTGGHLALAAELLASLPGELKDAAHDPAGAEAIVYLALLDDAEPIRARQWGLLEEKLPADCLQRVRALDGNATRLADFVKIPLIELALPALRHVSPEVYRRLKSVVAVLITADQAADLFEFALQKMLRRHLAPHFEDAPAPTVRIHELRGVASSGAALLSVLAYAGADTADEAARAFQRGVKSLRAPSLEFRMVPRSDCTLNVLEIALEKAAESALDVKRRLLHACAETVAADGMIRRHEAELLRAVADTLDCPMPPFTGQDAS